MPSKHSLFFPADDARIVTQVGLRRDDAIVVTKDKEGCVIHGPYIDLPKGKYRANIYFSEDTIFKGDISTDVCADLGGRVLKSAAFNLAQAARNDGQLGFEFSLDDPAPQCEVRLYCARGVSARVTGVEIVRLDPDAAWMHMSASGFRRHGAPSPAPLGDGDPASGLARRSFEAQVLERLERLERLSHGGQATYLGNNRVLAKVAIGDHILSYLMHADDRLLMPRVVTHGDHEPYLTSYFASSIRRNDHCLDVGANFGYFTCLMARFAYSGKTIGVEPDPDVFELARDNIYINSFEAIASALQAAVGERAGQLTLYRRMTRSGNTSIIPTSPESVRALGEAPPQPFDVVCTSVDELLPRFDGRIDVMKIDVEGAEPLVFRGAREALNANPHVKVVMEWSPGQIRAAGFDVDGFLGELDQMGFDAAVIGASGPERLNLRELIGHAYHSGVLLTRRR